MDINKPSTRQIGGQAKNLVAGILREFGLSTYIPQGAMSVIIAKINNPDRTFSVRVKSRSSGDWQISIKEGRSEDAEIVDNEYWVLVDFKSSFGAPGYYVMPGKWLRRNIYVEHREYLRSHGGVRPITPNSTHHKMTLQTIKEWKDRWDLITKA